MKWMSIFVSIVALLVDSEASGQVTRRRGLISVPVGGGGVALVDSTKPPIKIELAGGQSLTVTENATHTIFADASGKEIYSLARPLGMKGFWDRAVSPAKTAAAFMIARIDGGSQWHHHILIVRVVDDAFTFEEAFESGKDYIAGKNMAFSQMGAVSDDGKTLLAQVAVSPKGPGSVDYQWQTWEIAPAPKLLGVGLTIANGVVADKTAK